MTTPRATYRLNETDKRNIAIIRRHYNLDTDTAAIRLALEHTANAMAVAPTTAIPEATPDRRILDVMAKYGLK
jgi:hypothetical protein